MKPSPKTHPSAGHTPVAGLARTERARDRGVALLITLILLSLLGAASIAIVLLVSSDTMINGYYRNYRGSFYAADAGVNVVVEALKSSIQSAATDTANPPLPSTVPTSVTSSYSGYQSGYYSFGDSGSWNGQFQMVANPGSASVISIASPGPVASAVTTDSNSCLPVGAATCTLSNGTVVPNDGNLNWTVTYPYQITVQGISTGAENEVITETGSIIYTSTSGTAGGGNPPSFSKFAAFITNFAPCQQPLGGLAPGTMTGPFFTDGSWNFGNFSNPGYTFTGSIGQSGSEASWISNGSCQQATKAPSGFTKPNFPTAGLQLNQPTVVPPSDTYNQAQAVLDGKGIPPCTAAPCPADNPPTQAQMSAILQTAGGVSYPSSGSIPNAVYIPYYTGHGCANAHGCFGSYSGSGTTASPYVNNPAGGFYVNGNASVVLTASTGGDGTSNLTQTYAITTAAGTTTTLVVDTTAGTTTVTQGGTSFTLTGVPQQLNPNTGAPVPQQDPNGSAVSATMLYVNGSITGMTGPYSGSNAGAAIQNQVGITVAASQGVTITGDLLYVQSQLPVTIPGDASVSTSNAGVLGIFTNGNITLQPHTANGEITLDASLAALSGQTGTSATSGFEIPSCGNQQQYCISQETIVGGRAEDQAHSVSLGAGSTYFDTRFNGTFGPPWFPTAVPQPGTPSFPPSQKVTVSRSSWAETSRP